MDNLPGKVALFPGVATQHTGVCLRDVRRLTDASMLASSGMSSLLGATVLLNKQQQTDRHLASTHLLMGVNTSDAGVFSLCLCGYIPALCG